MPIVVHAGLLLILLLLAAAAGTLLIGSRKALALRCAAGLAIWGHALFLLAVLGQLRAPVIAALIVAVFFAAIVRRPALPPRRWPRSILLTTAGGAMLAMTFVLALQPPLAFDETLYHLPIVRDLAASGELRFISDLRFPASPRMHELLCVPPFLFGNDVSTHLVSLAQVAITAALLLAWGRERGIASGPFAAAFFLGSPIVVHLSTIGYVEPALTLFITAGFFALDEARQPDARRGSWLAIAGLFFGTACSVKYLGGYFAVSALLLVAASRQMRWKDVATFAACCAAAALPFTLWLTLTTGNPLFPYATSIFGATPYSLPYPPEPAGMQLLRPLRVLWDVTFARDRVNAQPPFTPFLIPALLFVIASVRGRTGRLLLAAVAGYLVIFAFLPQDSRYLLPLLPLLAIAAAIALANRWPRAVPWLALIAIAPGIAYAAHRLLLLGPPPATAQAREVILTRRIPEYAALRVSKGTVYVCGAEQLKYYAPGRLLGDFNGPHAYDRVIGSAGDTATIAANLHRIGASGYLVAKRVCASPARTGGMELIFEDDAAELWRLHAHGSSPHSR